MSRPARTHAIAIFLTLVATGCQDYNFNPVGQCVIQPGSQRFTLSSVSTADVLFVIDESGSMGGEQGALATNFNAFVDNLNAANLERAGSGLAPIDFHLAVTTSSVFWNEQTSATCRTDCPGAAGQAVCCASTNVPARLPQTCGGAGAACPVGTSCRLDCNRFSGKFHCCADDGSFPPAALTRLVPCSRVGTLCGGLATHYDMLGCTSPIAVNEWPYAQGDFVSKLSSGVAGFAGSPAPRVVHFDKELYTGGVNRQGFDQAELLALFRENIAVGTCGSGQEQHLQAARLALQKALSGQQRDTYDGTGTLRWTAPTATALPGSTPARWPNPNSKIVLVFVGDEDDCSSPADPSGGVVMLSGEGPNADACGRDGLDTTDASIRNKQFAVQEFVSYFTSLGRPVAAGFILPASQTTCTLDTCTTTSGLCCHPVFGCSSTDGAQAPGHRLLATAKGLQAAGVEVVAGSICDGSFVDILNDIADIVKPPQTLTLPTQPAENKIALLRIMAANGTTRKLCGAPLEGTYATLAEAQATGADWWFTETAEPGVPELVSRFVYINPQGACRANPGETYSADYLGEVPQGGCVRVEPEDGPRENPLGSVDCQAKLGGKFEAWACYVPPGMTRGTCTCRDTR